MIRYRRKTLDHSSPIVHERLRKLTFRDKRVRARLVANGETKTATEATIIVNLDREDKFSFDTSRRAMKDEALWVVGKKRRSQSCQTRVGELD